MCTTPVTNLPATAPTPAHWPTHVRGHDGLRIPAAGCSQVPRVLPDIAGTKSPTARTRSRTAPARRRPPRRARQRQAPALPIARPGHGQVRQRAGLRRCRQLRSRVNRSVPRLVCSVFARVLLGPHGARRAPSDDPRGAEIRTRVYRSCIGQVAGVYRSCIGDHARQARTGKAPPLLSGNPALRPGSRVGPVPGAAAHAPLGLGR